MTSLKKCPVLALRRLVFVALAVPMGACIAPNPGFIFETDGATAGMSDAGTATVATGSAGSTDAVPTTDASTSGAVTSTTAGTLPVETSTDATLSDATSSSETSIGGSTSDSSTGEQPACAMKQTTDFFAIDDAFFIAGGSDNGSTCLYFDAVDGSEHPCKRLNFGKTSALRVARMDGGIDAMYAVRFPGTKLADFVAEGNQIVEAQLVMTVYGEIAKPIEFRVGMITDQWAAGESNGTPAGGGESNFEEYQLGIAANPWTGGDGPRGAGSQVATLSVPVGYADHAQITSTPFGIDPWLVDPLSANGLVVSFTKDAAVETFGPGLKAMESGQFQPLLRVTHCAP
ncbi:MAG: hypothetical protein H0T76_19470 [Nannocystis sp.]|nr:hypothetical protein [Nannocystis sp.]MBA3548671.1 hypothetical protein [Nannocystis sp.]